MKRNIRVKELVEKPKIKGSKPGYSDLEEIFSISNLEFPKVVAMLDQQAVSSMGKAWVRLIKPERVNWKIQLHQAETSEARDFINREEKLPSFGDLSDVRKEVTLAMKGSTLSVSRLWSIMGALRSIRITKESLSSAANDYSLLKEYGNRIKSYPDLEAEIFRSLEDEETIADTATPDLQKYRHNLREKNYQIQERSRRLARKYASNGLLTDATFTIRNNRYVLPFSSGAMGQEKVVIQSTSESGLTFYGEPLELVELNNELQQLYQFVRNEEERILTFFSNRIGSIGVDLIPSIEICGYLDFIFAKGYLSRELKGVKPHFDPNRVELKQVRHPLIRKTVVIPIDLSFGGDRRGLIITGPNAGGKTVSLKSLGLVSLMAQAGLHIPADDGSSMPIFQSILAEIGDAQSIDLDLSSFGAHVMFLKKVAVALNEEFKLSEETDKDWIEKPFQWEKDNDTDEETEIRKEFSPYEILFSEGVCDALGISFTNQEKDIKPLVLIDEIGRSTDPEEGSALALALIDRLIAKNAFFALTTHLPALKNLIMNENSPVAGAAMGFDTDTMSPSYRIELESVGASYGLVIAEKMGLDPSILEGAKIRMKDRFNLLELDIPSLEKKRDELKGTVEKWEIMRASSRREELRELSRLIALKRMGIGYLMASIEKGEGIIRDSMHKSDHLLELARRGEKVRQEFSQKQDELGGLKRELEEAYYALIRWGLMEEAKAESPGETFQFQKGQRVWVAMMNREGIVEEIRKDGKRLVVIFDGKRMEISIEQASPVSEPKAESTRSKIKIEVGERKSTPLWLDLHGERVEPALEKVEEFLHGAFLDGRMVVNILHGIGTGKLRKAIRELLRKHPLVKSFRDGDASEGAFGTTIVEFKTPE